MTGRPLLSVLRPRSQRRCTLEALQLLLTALSHRTVRLQLRAGSAISRSEGWFSHLHSGLRARYASDSQCTTLSKSTWSCMLRLALRETIPWSQALILSLMHLRGHLQRLACSLGLQQDSSRQPILPRAL